MLIIYLHYFCNYSVCLKLVQNKELKTKLELGSSDLAVSQNHDGMCNFLRRDLRPRRKLLRGESEKDKIM